MKEQMKRTVYEAPETRLFRIELEGYFCASAEVTNPDNANGRIDAHEVNTGFSVDFSDETIEGNGWD